jgi:hypothetical protein
MIEVKDERGLVRDPHSKAVLNTDISTLENNRRKRNMMKNLHSSSNDVQILKQKVEGLESDISEIKSLLKSLLTK